MSNYHVSIAGREIVVALKQDGSPMLDGKPREIHIKQIDENIFSVLIDNTSVRVVTQQAGHAYHVFSGSAQLDVLVNSERAKLLRQYSTPADSMREKLEVHAPMPALVVKIEVAVGDEVTPGQGLIVLEAMKMENEIKAHQGGRVKEIFVGKGKPVEKGELLILLE